MHALQLYKNKTHTQLQEKFSIHFYNQKMQVVSDVQWQWVQKFSACSSTLIHFATTSPALEEGRVDRGQLNFVTPYFWDLYTLIKQLGAVKYFNRAVSYLYL